MWRRWTTEWALSVGERRLALSLLSRTDTADAPPERIEEIAHEDNPQARAAALGEALVRLRARHPGAAGVRRVRVLLDDRWAVWMSLQGAFWAVSPTQREALVRAHLAQQMGVDPSAWRVSSQVIADGNGLSACGMSETHVGAVLEAMETAGLSAVSLRPHWVDRLERLAPRLDARPCLIARPVGDLLCLAVRGAQDWLHIGSLQVDRDADWSARALGWWHGLGLPDEALVCRVDGEVRDCPPGWSVVEHA